MRLSIRLTSFLQEVYRIPDAITNTVGNKRARDRLERYGAGANGPPPDELVAGAQQQLGSRGKSGRRNQNPPPVRA